MCNRNICFIGGGNMARSLIAGLIKAGTEPNYITVGEPDAMLRDELTNHFEVAAFSDNITAAKSADIIILAVKPQVMETALVPLGSILPEKKPLLISIAAGINTATLQSWAGSNLGVVRVMPNTPALVNSGISALFANLFSTPAQHNEAEFIMSAVGTVVWVEHEALMDTVTSVSGSGPAYFFYLMEALEQAAIDGGIDSDTARILTLETALGAARLALESGTPPIELRKQVTSRGGTTEAAIHVLDDARTAEIIKRAVAAARNRSVELNTVISNN